MVELADTRALRALGEISPWRFESSPRHRIRSQPCAGEEPGTRRDENSFVNCEAISRRPKAEYILSSALKSYEFMDKNFGGVIWTNHALQRLHEREIKQSDAWATFRNPDQSRPTKKRGNWVYYRTYGNQKVEVVASQNEKKEWVILSVWSRPVYQRTRAVKLPSWWDNFLERILRSLFGRLKKP